MAVSFKHCLLLGALCALTGMMTACGTPVSREELLNHPHYWQRTDASSAIWLRGVKAQQTLNQDIANCVTTIGELERLGAIRHAIPGQTTPDGSHPNPALPEGQLAQWETPERDSAMRSEFLDYTDFETCMTSKGWERVENVPYDLSQTARDVYLETVTGEAYRTKSGMRDTFTPRNSNEPSLPAVGDRSSYDDMSDADKKSPDGMND
jgi:hypothetical protein